MDVTNKMLRATVRHASNESQVNGAHARHLVSREMNPESMEGLDYVFTDATERIMVVHTREGVAHLVYNSNTILEQIAWIKRWWMVGMITLLCLSVANLALLFKFLK